MKTIKTYLVFEHGKITESERYAQEVSKSATAIESLKFFLRHFIAANKLSGRIHIESRKGRLYLACDVKPKKYLERLWAELGERHDIGKQIVNITTVTHRH